MRTLTTIKDVRQVMGEARRSHKSIGFIPTMGALHAGHLALVERARQENEVVIVSVFVNPIQFGPTEDFDRYPRDLGKDAAMLESVGADYMFAPSVLAMYPQPMETFVEVPKLGQMLEGAVRPDYFRGVATVVAKLFNIVGPDRAYFGEKDYQQVLVVKRVVRDLSIPVEIVPVPTVRDVDGLALSSRNAYLTPEERKAALILSRALDSAKNQLATAGTTAKAVEESLVNYLAQEPLGHVDLLAVRDADTLEPLPNLGPRRALILLFVKFGKAQLLDQLVVELS
jgi:pantoate--beta-alanine ligase